MKKTAALFLIVLSAACATKPVVGEREPTAIPDATALLGENRAATFDAAAGVLRDAHYFSEASFRRMNTTWEKELEKPRLRFLEAKTADDVYYAFVSLINTVRDGHTWIEAAPELSPKTKLMSLPFLTVPILEKNKWEFIVLNSQHPEIKPGDRLVKYDGKTASEVIAEFREWHGGNSPEGQVIRAARWLYLRDPVKHPPAQAQTKLELRRGKTTIHVTTDWKERTSSPPDHCQRTHSEQADYDGKTVVFRGLGYCVYDFPEDRKVVRSVSFRYNFTPDELKRELPRVSYDTTSLKPIPNSQDLGEMDLKELVKYLRSSSSKTIVMDLRENGGGGMHYSFIAAFAKKPFMTSKIQMMITPYLRAHPEMLKQSVSWSKIALDIYERELKANPDIKAMPIIPFFCLTPKCEHSEAILQPTSELADHKLWLITGPNCMSACDQTVAIFKLNGIAKTAGMQANGSTSPNRLYPELALANGMKMKFVVAASRNLGPDGLDIEANPTRVDVPVNPTGKNYERYLEAILGKIGTNR